MSNEAALTTSQRHNPKMLVNDVLLYAFIHSFGHTVVLLPWRIDAPLSAHTARYARPHAQERRCPPCVRCYRCFTLYTTVACVLHV